MFAERCSVAKSDIDDCFSPLLAHLTITPLMSWPPLIL
jgi:hypothetical protein